MHRRAKDNRSVADQGMYKCIPPPSQSRMPRLFVVRPFKFWIFDFGFWIEKVVSFPQSKIQNPKSKIVPVRPPPKCDGRFARGRISGLQLLLARAAGSTVVH